MISHILQNPRDKQDYKTLLPPHAKLHKMTSFTQRLLQQVKHIVCEVGHKMYI